MSDRRAQYDGLSKKNTEAEDGVHFRPALSIPGQARGVGRMQGNQGLQPNQLVVGGDFYDCFSISDHDKEPGRCDFLQDEFDSSRETVKEIDDAAGDADVVFLDGNHEYRLIRMLHKNQGLFKLRSLELPLAAELPKL